MKRQARAEVLGVGAPPGGVAEPLRLPRALPRGHHRLARDVVLLSQRSRLLEAIVAAVAEKGWPATTVADVTARAGVSRATFYEQFSDREDCFLAAYEAGARVHFDHVVAAGRGPGDALERLRAAVHAYLEVLAAEPAWARTFILEIVAAGPRALASRLAVHRRYAGVLRDWHEYVRAQDGRVAALPEEFFVAAVGAINELVTDRVRRDETHRLAELGPVLTRVLTSLLGAHALLDGESRTAMPMTG
jgi:AcrR family transcriptional regulator